MDIARPCWPALVAASALALVCAVTAGVAAGAAGTELTRGPNTAELRAAVQRETAERWRTWAAGRVFPARLPYSAEQGGTEQASRIGISRRTSCAGAVDAAAEGALRAAGCRAVLRATYIDALRGVLVTVGVAAFPDERAAARAGAAFPQAGEPVPGLRPLAFRGTVADRFTPSVRQAGSVRQSGPYVVLTTAGQADGRPASTAGEQRPAVFAFGGELAARILHRLTTPRLPDCAAPEWQC
ncbi:hypothetical protein GCM10010149_29350 [Nonomuraea roseoviolacea subsp. roseoviolacea]|uniref:hypothetical protein n=1 Tax=Nonomuraea roseoviolacea TaxID=103837 RepID=UPI0031E3348B